MGIETAYAVNDMVMHRFGMESSEMKVVYRVMEIITNTCYAGTQVFYRLRPVCLVKKHERFKGDGSFTWEVRAGHSGRMTDKNNNLGWEEFREDELEPITQKYTDVLANAKA